MTLVTAHRLKFKFDETTVIKEASFELDIGDFVCVVGANGSGKSTLIKGILGLVKPASGSVKFAQDFSVKEIGYLPQETNFEANFPALVSEVVLSGTLNRLGLRICYPKSWHQEACEILKKFGILNLEKSRFSELSGGQKQKVLLARALVNQPKLLILDEPSNNLDYTSKKDFYNLLKKLNKAGTTIIMITHDLDNEDLIGNKILAIDEGEVKIYTTSAYLRRFKK